MKKITALSMALIITLASLPGLCSTSNVCDGITIETLRKHVPIPPGKIVSKRPVHNLCEIILEINGEYPAVYATKDFVIAGEMFENRIQITQQKVNEIRAGRFSSLKEEVEKVVAITYRPSQKIKHTIYMFTDPVCPYCGRAEHLIKKLADENQAEIKVIFFPVHIPVGRDRAVEAICRKLDFTEYVSKKWESENKTEDYQCEKGKNLVARSAQIARELGIRGVPTFFTETGRQVVGANMARLRSLLK